jgi:hypothetical protein
MEERHRVAVSRQNASNPTLASRKVFMRTKVLIAGLVRSFLPGAGEERAA